ncbi:uncharacterized protein BDV17DRAFT_271229 [Aspergillus undulatus]|uniref:uncharacterized protein n=1 Tax=Aspergillus undulatus TaxID=1810928 RepID=UPI003CCDD227
METVLVIGATGNIGASTVKAALNTKRNVLAIVRSQDSADKLVRHIGSPDGIAFVEADVLSDTGVRGVVDQVRAGKLPAFQHVYSCVGGEYSMVSLRDIATDRLRANMNSAFEAAFFAYRETIDYLLEQKQETTWTICTGSQGDLAIFPLPAMTQGALFSMATAGARENAETNVRFNEVYLGFRVEVDEDATRNGTTSASNFAAVYEAILARPEIRSSRVSVNSHEDLKDIKFARKF